jgi:hypothetical protein
MEQHRIMPPDGPVNPPPKPDARFNLTNSSAAKFASQHAAENTPNLTEEARQAIRLIVTRAFVEGGHPYQQAREIVKHLQITLEDKESVAAERTRLEGKRYKGEGLSKALDRFAGKLLRERARIIARTETATASNRGQFADWHEAAEKGFLNPSATMRVWIASGDPDTCAACMSMRDRPTTLLEPFETPMGPRLTPPMHDGCRCCMALRFDRQRDE